MGDDVDMDGILSEKREGADDEGTCRVAMQVSLLEQPIQKEPAISPLKEQEKKRPRRNGGKDDDDGDVTMNSRSVFSFEESDRAQ